MQNAKPHIYLFLYFLFIVFFVKAGQVRAYIDPGTTQAVFGGLSNVAPFIFGLLGVLFWPIKKLIRMLIQKLTRHKQSERK